MKRLTLPILLLSVFLLSARTIPAQEILPVDQLKPGMVATAKTVFQGDQIEEFGVEIIDMLRNFYPKRDLIIVRLRGEKAEFTGPVAGMSGSPVYYNGKIIGSLSYSLGNFLKEPLMGITPIREMLEIFDKEKRRSTELAAMGSREHMQRFVDMALALEPVEWKAFLPQRPSLHAGGFGVTQLPVLLNLSGFSDHGFELAQKLFAPLGFSAVRGGSSGSQNQGMDLVPGAPISAVLLTGDMSIDATGTVTYRDGDRVLAFGHPFFDNGPIELPMAQSHIITTISSAMASQKLGLTGKLVGTLRQDRTTGVMGILGPIPRMTEVTMRYLSEDGQQSQFSFSVAREKSIASISPLILRIALISALESARLSTGFNSLRLKGVVVLDDGEKLILDNLFPGYQPLPVFSFLNSILHSTGQIASTLAAITTNPFKHVAISRVGLRFESIPGRQSAELESVWVNRTRFVPGDTIEVSYRIRPYQGVPFTQKQQVVIPESIQGRVLNIVVGGGPDLTRYERRIMPSKFSANSYASLLRILRQARRNDRLFIQIRISDRGLIVNGEELPGLPPSVLPVLADRSNRNGTRQTRDRVVIEKAIPQKQMIEGIHVIRLYRQD
ncbi:MAG: SpoIVB peptidase S55 domain-containing protein [candidate division KSB1 bacterium]|nr:SpoIVB peptidase S55 domain-containing protein [candidate division KSB1 bacterium]